MSETWKLVFCVRRREDVAPEDFTRYWRENHAALVTSVRDQLGLVRYVQSHTVFGEHTDLLRASRGAAEPFDGIAEVWIDVENLEGERTQEALEAALALIEDEGTFVDLARSVVFWTREIEIFGPQ